MSELSEEQVQREINSRRDAVEQLTGQANSDGEKAARMRFLATAILNDLAPLRTALNGVRLLHTRHTWEGRAATASRERLDGHEERHSSAIRRLDELVDALEAQAQVLEQQRSDAFGDITGFRWEIHWLEQQQLHAASLPA